MAEILVPLQPVRCTSEIVATLPVSVTPFDGAIDDVRIYNEALTAAQIQDLFGPPLEEHPGLAGLRVRASSEFLRGRTPRDERGQ